MRDGTAAESVEAYKGIALVCQENLSESTHKAEQVSRCFFVGRTGVRSLRSRSRAVVTTSLRVRGGLCRFVQRQGDRPGLDRLVISL